MAHIVKKTIELDEDLIAKVRKFFEVKTDKEAVNLALALVASEDQIISAHLEVAGKLSLDTPFK